MKPLFTILLAIFFLKFSSLFAQELPAAFDLRDVNGLSSVRAQQGGTCWAFGIMASVESSLMVNGHWEAAGEAGEADLAEYHLDWWNGFNEFYNADLDPPEGSGTPIHHGGSHFFGAAYFARGEGAVRDVDGQSYEVPPKRFSENYHYFYVRDINWYNIDSDLNGITEIKQAIKDRGALKVGLCYYEMFISPQFTFYQPPESPLTITTHAVAIVGWDDDKMTQAPLPGAWLCKNSWGTDWGLDGFFWVSYYDKCCCKQDYADAVSFHNAEAMKYDTIYYHDYHGWTDTKQDSDEAFSAFTVPDKKGGLEIIQVVSFFTAVDSVDFIVKIYDRFEDGELSEQLAEKTGSIAHYGFHTVDLDTEVELTAGNDFYVYLYLSQGGQPCDRTAALKALTGISGKFFVESTAHPGESYCKEGDAWLDLYELDPTANFCIKALANSTPVGMEQTNTTIIHRFKLDQNYPNPFNPETVIRYQLSVSSPVELTVYNSLGQKVKTLISKNQLPGDYQVNWDGTNQAGQAVSSGIYFYCLKAGKWHETRKMVLLR